jgi:ribokinase
MDKVELFVCGNLTIDDNVMFDGTTRMGICGGDSLYAALGASWWINNVGIITRAGEDFELQNLEKCRNCGIETSGIKSCKGESIRNWVIYEKDGRRTFIYRSGPERFYELSPDESDIPVSYKSAKVVFIAAMPIENQIKIIEYMRSVSNCIIILDPYEEDALLKKDIVLNAAKMCDIFMPSEEEEKRLMGNENHEFNAHYFASLGPEIVVIKLGSKGSLVYEKQKDSFTIVSPYRTKVVDVTGAGDSFGGGFAAGYFLTGNPVTSAEYGSVSASFAIEDYGNAHLLNRNINNAKSRLEDYYLLKKSNK